MTTEDLKRNYIIISGKKRNYERELQRTKKWMAMVEKNNPNIKEEIKNGI